MIMNQPNEYADDELPLPSFYEVFGEGGPNPSSNYPNYNNLTSSQRKKKKMLGPGGKMELNDDESKGRWTAEEHRLFLEGIMLYGKDWKKMQPLIKTRSLVQIRTHAQKVFKKIGLKKLSSNPTSANNPNARGGGSGSKNNKVNHILATVASGHIPGGAHGGGHSGGQQQHLVPSQPPQQQQLQQLLPNSHMNIQHSQQVVNSSGKRKHAEEEEEDDDELDDHELDNIGLQLENVDDEEDEGEDDGGVDDGEHVHNLHETLGHHQHNPHHLDPHHHDPHHLVDPQSHLHYANMNSMQMHGMGDSSMIHHQQHLTAAAMSQSHHLSGIPPHLQMSLPPGVGGGGIGMPNPQQQQQYAMLQQFQQHQQQHYMQQQQQQQQQQQIPRNMGMPSEYH